MRVLPRAFFMELTMHYYQFNIGDYIKQTAHLLPLEDLAYRRLLDMYYDTEKPIPNDIPLVSRRLRLDFETVSIVLKEFFILTENGYQNTRADKEIADYHNFINKQKSNGSKGGRPKKPTANPTITQTEPKKTLNNNHKPLTNNHNKYIPPIPSELLSEWLLHRKKKPVTERVFKSLESEANKLGWTVIQAVEHACANSWQGFKADWVTQGQKAKVNDRAGAIQAIFGKQINQQQIIEKDITNDAITF